MNREEIPAPAPPPGNLAARPHSYSSREAAVSVQPRAIVFRSRWDRGAAARISTAGSVHAARQAARRAILRIRLLERVYGSGVFVDLANHLHELVRLTGPSRDSEVQSQLFTRLTRALREMDPAECRRIDASLKSRKHAAALELARALESPQWCALLARINLELDALRGAQSLAELPQLAMRGYEKALLRIASRIHGDVTGPGAHRLRKTVRRACDLATLREASSGKLAGRIDRRLEKLQSALGELRDLEGLAQWLREANPVLASPLAQTLESATEAGILRCRWRAERLRQAID